MKSKQVGTPLYLSPEIIKKMPYDHRTDVFSLGVVMYQMAALEPPFQDKTHEGLMNKILFKFCDPYIKKKYEDYLELVEPSQQKDFF